jgi:hypothetical protein
MGRIAGMYNRSAYKVLARKPDEKNHYEDLNVDGRVLSEVRL